MARARKKGDDTYNARRRYVRQAQRYLSQADKLVGNAARRMRELARQATENAIGTYEGSPNPGAVSKAIKALAERFDLTLRGVENRAQRRNIIRNSEKSLEKNLRSSKSARREFEAQQILSGSIGHRIYGATVDIWKNAIQEQQDGSTTIDRAEMNRLIMEHFGVSDMMGVIEIFESKFDSLYDMPESDIKYDEIVLAAREIFHT